VSDAEIERRATLAPVTVPSAPRGYRKLFLETVTQADKGVDFEFLRSEETRGSVPRK
jgi:dihydroxy-acid dehydratase